MSDQTSNPKSFNLPSYINIPLFLYQDNRIEKASTIIAAFFYSLFTAGKSIKASKEYLCELAGIAKSQYYCTLNQLESCGYITRTGHTNNRKIIWIYRPSSEIIVLESDISPAARTSDKKLNTSPANRTKLVRPTGLNLSGIPDIDNKDNKKVNTTTTAPTPEPEPEKTISSSSNFFSKKIQKQLLDLKLKSDAREDDLFLEHCRFHIENQKNENSLYQKITGLKNLLIKLNDVNECFNAKGFNKITENKKISYLTETESQRKERQYFENELFKESTKPGYISKDLQKYPEMRAKYQRG